jgi:hypothetical protein
VVQGELLVTQVILELLVVAVVEAGVVGEIPILLGVPPVDLLPLTPQLLTPVHPDLLVLQGAGPVVMAELG